MHDCWSFVISAITANLIKGNMHYLSTKKSDLKTCHWQLVTYFCMVIIGFGMAGASLT